MCNSPQLWNRKAKLSIVWTLYSSKCTCARARVYIVAAFPLTGKKKEKKKSTQRTNKPTNYWALSAQKTYQEFIHAEEKPKNLRGVGAHRHRRARAREREERTNERTAGRTEVLNIRSNCGRRRGDAGRVREGYINTLGRVKEGRVYWAAQIPADPGKVIKNSIYV
jgi:hypothetical protein